jgi:hypothetical protein
MPVIIELLIQVFAGVGLAHFADKILPDKVSSYPAGGLLGEFKPLKFIWTVSIIFAGIFAFRFLKKKLKLKF